MKKEPPKLKRSKESEKRLDLIEKVKKMSDADCEKLLKKLRKRT